jgi:hypothetical protein
MNNIRTINLPEDLCRTVEQKFGPRFGALDQVVAAVLSELLRDDALKMDVREEQIIEERLKGLGYI